MTWLTNSRRAFFVGYLPTPGPLALFLVVVSVIIVGIGIGAGFAVVLGQQDPGTGRMAFGKRQVLSGIIEMRPYPVLRVADNGDGKKPRAIVLSGVGKRGIADKAAPHAGKPVDVGGIFIIRDGATMLQVGGRNPIRATAAPDKLAGFEPAAEITLGRYRFKGEIIDSKCFLGAMRPGHGKVHMACAGLCLIGGVPPMFAVYHDDGPPDLMLLAAPDGGPVAEALLVHVSLQVSLEGELRRRDNQFIFRVDPASLQEL